MSTGTFLIIFLFLSACALLGWEWFAIKTGKKTITTVTQQVTDRHPWLVFLAGFLIGGLGAHFWF